MFSRQNGLCLYCGIDLLDLIKKGKHIHTEHRQAKANGGGDGLTNLGLACAPCNRQKRDTNEAEFRIYLQPYLDGKIARKDLREYWQYQKLKEKFNETN